MKNPDELDVSLSSLMQSVIDDEQPPGNAIITHPEGIDLLPSNIELSGMETGLFNVMSREYVLKNAIDGMKKNYDYILIDCIVTEEEFARVQEILAQKSIKSGKGKNARKVGHKPHSTVWGRLMICQCGKRFNMHFHERKDRDPGVDYQCYTSVNRGSQTERQKRGLSMEGTCDTPFIPGWKMEMMASHLFKRYIKNADDTLQLA